MLDPCIRLLEWMMQGTLTHSQDASVRSAARPNGLDECPYLCHGRANKENCESAGTDDGAIHLCSVNMSDRYVESYFGHSGPVYRVAWSPGSSDTFASASADGTTCIWRVHQVRTHAALSGAML